MVKRVSTQTDEGNTSVEPDNGLVYAAIARVVVAMRVRVTNGPGLQYADDVQQEEVRRWADELAAAISLSSSTATESTQR